MSDETPTIDNPHETFDLDSRPDKSLPQLVEEADFGAVHFFLADALDDDAIDVEPADENTAFALVPYSHPDSAIDDDTWELLDDEGYQQATFRDLLNFAIERPGAQREFDIVALDTIRTRRVYEDREGQTNWTEDELDKSVCQWATGLSNYGAKRALIPVEIYLDKVLRKDAMILVRTT